MDQMRTRHLAAAGYRRRRSPWKKFGVGATGGAAIFAGVLAISVGCWGIVEMIRYFDVSLRDLAAWGLAGSALAGGAMRITDEEKR